MYALRPVVFITLLGLLLAPQAFAEDEKSLFINLTSDQTDRAVMAIALATMVQADEKIPATIFLNVDGVRIADKRLPQKKNAEGKDPQQMLAAFIEAGGTVFICPMCMTNVGGMSSEDIVTGIALAKPETTFPAMFKDNVTVLVLRHQD